MTKIFLLTIVLASNAFVLIGQSVEDSELKRAVLLSPYVGGESPKWDSGRQGKQWAQMLPGHGQISYGNRFGDNWDIMALDAGSGSRTRMVELGKYNWNDSFDIPYVKPLRKLLDGETRTISVNTSGTKAPDGKTYGTSTVENQAKAGVKTESGKEIADDFKPYIAARVGYIYLMRVVDPTVDQYVLIRVDDIERGDKLYISFKKIAAPAEPIF